MKKTATPLKKLSLHRETIAQLQTESLDRVLGNNTYTASFPCCPLTRNINCD